MLHKQVFLPPDIDGLRPVELLNASKTFFIKKIKRRFVDGKGNG